MSVQLKASLKYWLLTGKLCYAAQPFNLDIWTRNLHLLPKLAKYTRPSPNVSVVLSVATSVKTWNLSFAKSELYASCMEKDTQGFSLRLSVIVMYKLRKRCERKLAGMVCAIFFLD